MFGIVPKALWARRAPPDDRNRIPLALRCLLIEHDDGLVLIDTGIGNKENSKFIDIYGVQNAGRDGQTARTPNPAAAKAKRAMTRSPVRAVRGVIGGPRKRRSRRLNHPRQEG